jgi:hypothetical protein
MSQEGSPYLAQAGPIVVMKTITMLEGVRGCRRFEEEALKREVRRDSLMGTRIGTGIAAGGGEKMSMIQTLHEDLALDLLTMVFLIVQV